MPNEIERLKALVAGETETRDDASRLKDLVAAPPVSSQSELNIQSGVAQQGFKGNGDYDKGLTFGSNQNNLRASNQPFLHELANGAASAIINIVPQTLGNLAAIADIGDYYNKDNEVGNSITRAMMDFQKEVNADVVPIYQSDNVDMGSQEYWTSAGRDLVTSIGAFVATGAATGGVLNYLSKGASLIKGLNSLGDAGKAVAAMVQATALNQAEGIQSAIGVYDTTYNEKLKFYEGEENAEELARQDAAAAAALTVNVNRLTIPLNLTSGLAFLRTPNSTRALIENPGMRTTLRNILGEGIQEASEEEINLIAEKAGTAKGAGKDYGVGDVIGNIFSKEGFASGLLGFIGGAAQTGAIAGLNRINGTTAEQESRYVAQQSSIAEINEILTQNNIPSLFDVVKTANDQIGLHNELQEAENPAQASSIAHTILAQQSYSSFTAGTAGVLLDTYKQFANLSSEEAAQRGLDINPRSEDHYVMKAQKAQHQIEKLEKIYNKIPNLPNKEQVFYAQAQRLQLNNRLSELSVQEAEAQTELMTEKANRGIELDLDNSNPVTQKLQSYKELQAILEQKKFYQEAAIKLDERLDYIQSPQYIVDKQTKAEKEAADQAIKDSIIPTSEADVNAAEMTPESKQEASDFIASEFTSPEDVTMASADLSPETLSNPIIAQQIQLKTDKAIQEGELRNVFEGIQAREPEVINDGVSEVPAIKLDAIEQQLLNTTHSHIRIEGNRIKLLSDVSENNEEPVETEVPESVIPPVEDDFLTSLHAPIETSDEIYEELENSKKRDEQKGIIGTTVRQFQLKGKGLDTTIPLKNGLPIEITGLQTPGDIPFDFKMLNSPEFNVGTKVYLTYMPTTYEGTTYDTIFVNYRNEVGELVPVTQINTQNVNPNQVNSLINAVKAGEIIETTISEKYIDKTNRVSTGMNYSLTDLALNSPQHLPEGKIFIGQMYKGQAVISGKDAPTLDKVPNIPEGRSFVLITDPRGKVYPDVLFQNPSKDVEIGGRTVDKIVMNRLMDFMNENSELPLKEMKSTLENLKDELSQIIDIGRRPYNTFNIGVAVNPSTGNNELYLNVKGTKTFDIKEISKLVASRPLAIKAEALVSNKPFTIDGVTFPSYVDFLISTKAVATNIYTKQPFRDARLKIDLNPVLDPTYQNNPRKVELGAKYGTPKFRLVPSDLDPNIYKVWDKAQELAWIQTNLPQVPVTLVEDTKAMYEKFGMNAFGAFQDGVIYLANNTESGTLYHEAFHAVFNNFLTEEQRSQFTASNTEEELAEQFRSYNLTDGLIKPSNNALVRFFQDIFIWTKNLLGLDLLNNLFYKINSGGFAGEVNQYQFAKDSAESIANMVTKAGEANALEIGEYVGSLSEVDDFRSPLFSAINQNITENYTVATDLLQNSNALENYFRTLPSGDLNSLGFSKPVDFDEFYSQLSELVKNSESAEEMSNIVIENALTSPALAEIAQDLNGLNGNTVSQLLWENFSTIETVAQKRLNNAGVDSNIKFDTSNNFTAFDAYEAFESGLIPAIGGASWNLPIMEGEVFLPDGNVDTESPFFAWFTENLQKEYATISTNANNLFKQPEQASQNISDYTAKTFEVLNDLTWLQVPKKVSDVNLVDFKVIDFNDPNTLSIINDFLIANFSRERNKLKGASDEFIANSIYSAVEATNLLFPEGRPNDLNVADISARAMFQTPIIASNEVIPVDNNIAAISDALETSDSESLRNAYKLTSIADGEVDTVLPIDFPTIATNSLDKIVGNPSEITSATLDLQDSTAVEKEVSQKYSGKKNWWSPSYQLFLNKEAVMGKMNNNSFTAGVINQLGNQELSVYFVNQPIIRDLTESYFQTANLQASVNQITKDYKMDFIYVNDIYDYAPKEFALQDLRDGAGDEVDVLKTFISYKLKETTVYPNSVTNFSDFSPNFVTIQNTISSLFGKELSPEEIRFINQEYKTYQLSRPGTFLDMTDAQKEQVLSEFPDIKSVSTQELWDRFIYGNSDQQVLITNYLRADIMKRGLHSGIHSNFIVQLGLNEDFRDIKRSFDIEPTGDVMSTFIDQFVSNNFQTLDYVPKGDISQTNKPLYLVSDEKLFKFVNGEYIEQLVSSYKQYKYGEPLLPVFSSKVDPMLSLKQNLIENGINLNYSSSEEDVIREFKNYCLSL